MIRASLAILVFLSMTSLAKALEFPTDGDKAVPCRPTVSCNANLAASGTVELESGFLFSSLGAAGNQSSFPFLTKWTLASWSQLQIGSDGYTVLRGSQSTQFFNDLTAGAKFHLLDQHDSLPSVSFSATASIPTAPNQNGYARNYDSFLVLYVSRDFGAIHADFNAGLNLWGVDKATQTQQFVALALSTNLSPKWSIALENYYFSDASPLAAHDAGLRSALAYSPRSWLVLDVGGDVGYYPSMRTFSVFSGLTIVPAVLWRTK